VETELTIGRLQTLYLVPRGHPSPELVRHRLDDTARSRLEAACEMVFARVLDPSDKSLWFVRSLDLDVSLDAAMEPDRIAEFWASRIARGTAEVLARGPDSDRVIRFAGPDDYVAAYVSDAAAGKDRRCWYYRAFDSLAVLPRSAAIRTVLTREPGLALRVLQKLNDSRRLEPVLKALRASDVELLAEACAASADEAGVARVLPLLSRLNHAERLDTPHNALRLYAWLGPAAGELVMPLLECAELCRIELRAAEWLAAGNLGSVAAAARELGRGDLVPGCARTQEALGAKIRELAPAGSSAPASHPILHTPYGGIFLLLPALLEVVPAELLELPEMRARVLAAAMGAGREIYFDAAFRFAVALTGSPEERSPAPDVAASIVEELRARDRLGGRQLTIRRVNDWLVVTDARYEEWIAAVPAHLGVDAAVDLARERLGIPPDEIVTGAPEFFSDEDDASIVLAAHAVLRAFASRLPGFAASSVAHLRANLLRVPASLQGLDATLYDVPLSVVLRIAGVHGREVAVPWLGGRLLRTFLAEA
jgi:hypothetical protein